ncbi:DUF2764 family protein [Thiospirochaeta perfilievii]|uniref:DUF2764 family protein n=1 Tax=Thiospirochaeta perfilievii TaxID=252967 RepID=A0A5C1QEH8_9SPIO|nr:DUF2764 family protein [Thiospirochaeta perfilievii]QEN05797.1 DUF2764 family protein [Thiospirochaeta perfilievii]
MGQYYFTAASLPILSLESIPSITLESFLSTCELHLSKRDFKILFNSSIKIPENENSLSGVAKVCWDWEKSLRNELAKLRAAKINKSAEEYVRTGDMVFDTQRIASEAFKIESPLEAETYLNVARLSFLESLSVGHYFDITFLVIYYLKLQILDRISNFDTDKGFKKYKEIYKNILTAYEAGGSEI